MADDLKTKLEKAFAQRAATSPAKPLWQEWMERHASVPSSKSILAPDILKGFSGSWAASFELGSSVKGADQSESPAQIQNITNKLGQPGLPEINFRPYDWGTSRHGKYGPSLLGHPISFEVIGPTAKSDNLFHQWWIDEQADHDEISMDTVTVQSTVGVPDLLPAVVNSLLEVYGISSVPAEGLYLVVSLTGSPGAVNDNGVAGSVGGVGDGLFGDDATPPIVAQSRAAIVPITLSSKYEIFRVVSISGGTLVLDDAKRLINYFIFDSGSESPIIRAITLIRPAATRMVAVPGSGAPGQETVFAFVPPAFSLNSDMQPSFYQWDTGGLFDPWSSGPSKESLPSGATGSTPHFSQLNALPLPNPLYRGKGRLWGSDGEVPVLGVMGTFRLFIHANSPHASEGADVGRVLCIREVHRVGGAGLATETSEASGDHEGDATVDRLIGYFEIVGWGAAFYTVQAIAQFDPDTGTGFWFSSQVVRRDTPGGNDPKVDLEWTIHEPISTLWTSEYLHPPVLDSARLTNLIDPRWVEPTLKQQATPDGGWGGTQGFPDRAIFDTASSNGGVAGSNADPGSLMDLGFRVVLFPAKESGANLVPDYDFPLDMNEVSLDNTVDEDQFITVDYSAGLARLSHPVNVTGDGQLLKWAGILANASNPRGELVFFASCVPFSREPGQMGANPRVTGGQQPGAAGTFCQANFSEAQDVFGSRKFWPAADQTLSSGSQETIELDVALSPTEIPSTGFVDVLLGDNDPNGPAMFTNSVGDRLCTFGYGRVDYVDTSNGNNTTLLDVYGGADPVAPATYAVVNGATPATVVLRRSIVTPNTLDGQAGTDYRFDTTYGSAKRAETLRFANSRLHSEQDGSVTIEVLDPRVDAHAELFKELFSSWCISGGVMTTTLGPANAGVLDFDEQVVLIQGVRSEMPAQQVTVNLGAGYGYVYVDSADPQCPVYATTNELPLPTVQDVLIGRYVQNSVDVTVWIDLRQPLVDTDKRLDVTVGLISGHDNPGAAHFNELADAVQFVVETMDPETKTGVGDLGKYRRIKVIGPTEEDNAKLPIAHPGVSGIIIEGAGWSDEVFSSIKLLGDTTALFDLSGCSGWIFRDLSFLYDSSGGAATTPTVANRCLAVVLDGLAENIVFENIRMTGAFHGMLFIDDSADPATSTYNNIVIRNCVARNLTEFAVYIDPNVEAAQNLRISNCDFVCNLFGDKETVVLAGVIHAEGDSTNGVYIRDNRLEGGYYGVYLKGAAPQVVDGNYIALTYQIGIVSETPECIISNNKLISVHIGAATLHTAKAGIYLLATADFSRIENNSISFSGGSAGDDSIYAAITSTLEVIIQGNNVSHDIEVYADCVVSHNKMGGRLYIRHAENRVSENLVGGDLELHIDGDYSRFTGNVVEGLLKAAGVTGLVFTGNWFKQHDFSNHEVGIDCTHQGDIFGDFTDGAAGGRVTMGTNGLFTGCRFADGFESAAANNTIEGCEMEWWTGATLSSEKLTLANNRIKAKLINLTLAIGTEQVVFTGNNLVFWDVFSFGGNGSSITGNWFQVGTDIELDGVNIQFVGNMASSMLTVTGSQVSVVGNFIQAAVVLSGNNIKFSNNHLATALAGTGGALVVTGCEIAGNTTAGASNNPVQIWSNNRFLGTFTIPSGDEILLGTISNNSFNGVVNLYNGSLSLNDCTFTGNVVSGAFDAQATLQSLITGNRFISTVIVEGGTDLTFANNYVGSTAALDSLANSNVTGNRFSAPLSILTTSDLVFQGNRAIGAATFTGLDAAVVVGNLFGSDVTFTGGIDGGDNVVFTGNRVGGDLNLTLALDYVAVGNRIVGAILVTGTAAPTPHDTGVIVGNRATSIASAVAAPTNHQVTIGNMVNQGAKIFNVEPGDTSQVGNNAESDV